MASFIKRHPLIAFFVLAFGLSWGSYLLTATWSDVPFLFPFGPFVAAFIVAGASGGKMGLLEILRRGCRWRVGPRWYAAAFLVPAAITLVAVALNIQLGATLPAAQGNVPLRLLGLFPLALIDAPLWEETGWRGFALPGFPANRSPRANTLILGLLIAAWHLPLALADRDIAAPYLIAALASAVVTNWVYYNAHESALLAILYHTAANAIAGFYLFPLFTGPDLVRLWWLYAAVYGVAALAAASRLDRIQRPLP